MYTSCMLKKIPVIVVAMSITAIIIIGLLLISSKSSIQSSEHPEIVNAVEVAATNTSTIPNPKETLYVNEDKGISFYYPEGYSIDEAYVYSDLALGKQVTGVKLTIPADLAMGTNLSTDTAISIETADVSKDLCTPAQFLSLSSDSQTTVVGPTGIQYLTSSLSDAGAGNRYKELVYTVVGSEPCRAIRYFIHSSAIDNYEPGTVQEFNEATLISSFDTIRDSLIFKLK